MVTDRAKQASGGLGVGRILTILELLADAQGGMSLSALARNLDLNKQIISRLIALLESASYIYKDSSSGRYQLSYKLTNLGLRRLTQSGILDPSSSVIRDLANETGELVRLALAEGDKLTWVLAAVGKQRTLHIDPNYTLEIKLHSTATGKAWLSTMQIERAMSLMKRDGLTKLTPFTITALDALKQELIDSKNKGWAISIEETELGVGAVAAPVVVKQLNDSALCVGTISVAAPTTRMSRMDFEVCAPLVMNAASRLGDMWPQANVPLVGSSVDTIRFT
ncbi:MAG TPA: IclR family transcriptional regulator [Pirellula sp.]|nr:IclR family transcriptional regulator [Pirellula sp.]